MLPGMLARLVILAQCDCIVLNQGHGSASKFFVPGGVAAGVPQPPPGRDVQGCPSGSAWGCGWLHLRGGAGSPLDMESAAGSGSSGSFGVVEPDWLRDIKEKQARGETPSLEAESSWNAPGTHSQKYPLTLYSKDTRALTFENFLPQTRSRKHGPAGCPRWISPI
jgi:hypothetical protein